MTTRALMTVKQFDQLPEREGTLYELNEGEVVTVTEPMPGHNWVRDNIARLTGNFVEDRRLGRVFVETGYQLGPDTVRIPDVSFVPADRMREIDLDKRIQGAPALAIEVVSPTDLAQELTEKVKQYIAAEAKAVWVLYPKTWEVHVFCAGEVTVLRKADDVLEDQEILPGFSVSLAALFE